MQRAGQTLPCQAPSRHTGDYRLSIRDQGCPTTPLVGSQVAGSWISSDCASSRRAGRFVDYYTFEVEGSQTRTAQIDLVSSTDPYLYLVTGSDPAGTAYLTYDDDGGEGLNSQIMTSLAPGTYTIGATAYGQHDTGSYTLTVSGHR